MKAESDPWLALLAVRNTPMEIRNASPSQLLFSRRCKTLLPVTQQMLVPRVVPDAHKTLLTAKKKQADQYNVGAHDLPILSSGEVVRVQSIQGGRSWKKAVVQSEVAKRSYQVQSEDGAVYRRNRRHLRSTKEAMRTTPEATQQEESAAPDACPAQQSEVSVPSPEPPN
eukprot:m.202986 g.202986  ORF g.202986 m.202986 type:complete len:169 (+) comp39617_c0_seq4:680-1186(+)